MEKFVRPALCRLCECPAGLDGVRMSDVDIEKLSRWWGKALETEFEDEELEKKFFCQICLWDAKFQGEKKKSSDGCDWWTGHDTNTFYRKFYSDAHVLQACEVKILPLTLPPDTPDASGRNKWVRSSWRAVTTKCVYCAKTFESKRAAFRHALQAHGDIKRFSCFQCHLNFVSEDEKKVHRKKFHPTGILCHCCKKEFKPNSLLRHISEKYSGPEKKIFDCCGEKFLNQDALVKHFKSVKMYKSVICVYCGKLCSSNSHLWHHVGKFHRDVAIKCNYWNCGKYFLSENEKQHHVAEMHKSKTVLVQCLYCQRKFTSGRLSYHISLQHHSEAIRCTFNSTCLTFFHSQKDRENHEQKVHCAFKLVNRPKCKKCRRTFFTKIHLQNHLQQVHKLNATICKTRGCYEYFSSNSDLDMHFQEKHSEDEARKKFQCNDCSYKTIALDSLKSHINAKHLLGNFKCEKCEKVCKSKPYLLQHIRLYHGERKVCPHCHYEGRGCKDHFRIDPCHKCGFLADCKGLRRLHIQKCNPRC